MKKDEIWRAKIRNICDIMPEPTATNVYNEIVEAVEARIDEARDAAEECGRDYGFWQGRDSY